MGISALFINMAYWTSAIAIWAQSCGTFVAYILLLSAVLCRRAAAPISTPRPIDYSLGLRAAGQTEIFMNGCVRSLAVPGVSSSLYACTDRRLLYAASQIKRVYAPKHRRSCNAILVALILLLGGVESNPGPSDLKLGVLNVRSAQHKAALLHDVIADYELDLLVVTETWLHGDQPTAITEDIAPAGYTVFHDFRPSNQPGGGVAVICRGGLQCAPVGLLTARTCWQCLVVKVTGRGSRLNLAAVYRPPTSSSYGISIGQFCAELDETLAELLELPGVPLVCGDFNCPGSGASLVDHHLADLIEARNLVQRVDVPTHVHGNTLDLVLHLDGGLPLTTAPSATDVGFSDHSLVRTEVHVAWPKVETCTYTYRNLRNCD